MKLVHTDLSIQIELDEGSTQAVIVENTHYLWRLIADLKNHASSDMNGFVLSDAGKSLSLEEYCCFITDFTDLDPNGKKVVNELLKRLKNLAYDEEHYMKTMEISSKVSSYLTDLILDFDSELTLNEVFDVGVMLKSVGVHFEARGSGLLDQLSQFMFVLREFCGLRVFVFLNLSSFLTDEEHRLFVQFVEYEKFRVVFFESSTCSISQRGVKSYIIDSDLCEIFDDA